MEENLLHDVTSTQSVLSRFASCGLTSIRPESIVFGSSVRVPWPGRAPSYLSGAPREAKEMLLNPTGF